MVVRALAQLDEGDGDRARIREVIGSGSLSGVACNGSTWTVVPAGAKFQRRCLVHDAYGPLRASHRHAARDDCPMLVARLKSHEHWLDGTVERVLAERAERTRRIAS